MASAPSLEFQGILDDFTERWQRGEPSSAEEYLARLDSVDPRLAVSLIYREYCLAELAEDRPEPTAFVARFPQYQARLERLFALHRQCESSQLRQWTEPSLEEDSLPEPGDEIGPYILKRELGRGSFARVFLAEQADLANRYVVVKVSTGPSREPWLLAKARHANIVEILSHASVDDGAFQLICMPFLGGATLSAVLSERRRSYRARGCRGGFLNDLDEVAAAEYQGANAARPARELLRSLSDAQAMAWITARLAEALDHASTQDVAHGDVKPSNILLTADGTPMLLDFNLAHDWSLCDAGRPAVDPGGTFAYMAPERLRAIALTGSLASSSAMDPSNLAQDGHWRPADPHRADIYSLGMVLLEGLTLKAPPPAAADQGWQERGARGPRELAASYASFRERGAPEVIRAAMASGGGPIPPALRSILEQCLASRPEQRYRRATELAEDLDRWRTDRPLAYADEPFWTHTLPRSMRRNRRVLSTAALAILVSVLTTFVMLEKSRSTGRDRALHLLARSWDNTESGAFHFQRPGLIRPQNPNDPKVLATAVSALKDYDVFKDENWRQKDAIQTLPTQDREDLELWLMEQAFRYCRALEQRASSPDEWLSALTIIKNVNSKLYLEAFDELRDVLISKLGQRVMDDAASEGLRDNRPDHEARSGSEAPQGVAPPWLNEFFLGLAAELDDETGVKSSPAAAGRQDLKSADRVKLAYQCLPPVLHEAYFVTSGIGLNRSGVPGSRIALRHYLQALEINPGSFWAHYRAAVVCFRIEQWGEATNHLERCQKRRPNNPMIPAILASCLCEQGRSDAALQACDRALELAPDHAEFFRTRAFIRATQGQTQEVESDIERFEVHSRFLSRSIFHASPARGMGEPRPTTVNPLQVGLDIGQTQRFTDHPGDPMVENEILDPDDLDARAVLAAAIHKAGGRVIAAAELDKIFVVAPDQLRARLTHMMQELEEHHWDAARADLDVVLDHSELNDYLGSKPKNSTILVDAARQFAIGGMARDALRIADKLVRTSVEMGLLRGRFHFTRAEVMSVAARTDPAILPRAARQLTYSYHANSRFKEWYRQDKLFDPVRVQIDAIIEQLPDLPSRF
jgi:serine/threonine protein kinase